MPDLRPIREFIETLGPVDPEKPVLLAGPTAVGKSAYALELAKRDGRAIVNADALQVYDGWEILTARPTAADLGQARHYLYGHVNYQNRYSVGDWLRNVAPLIAQRPAPIIIGGTGLYFRALTNGLADIPPSSPEIRAQATEKLESEGLDALLSDLDAQTLARIDQLNPMRVQRAWEVQRQTGRGLAAWHEETGPALVSLDQAHAVVLAADPAVLGQRIDQRFDAMLAQGAMSEVAARAADWDPARQSSQAIGAPELMAAWFGKLPLDQAVDSAKTSTKQYAKRQRTWFRNKMSEWMSYIVHS
ncbi:MAG: tRNA (adenosine(37)-N6)-dimethylallyltransferase MiaA [Mangrovicoccus sp.]